MKLGNVEMFRNENVLIYGNPSCLLPGWGNVLPWNAKNDLWTRLEILLDVLVFVFLVQTCQCCITKQDECGGPVMLHLLSCCDELNKLLCTIQLPFEQRSN